MCNIIKMYIQTEVNPYGSQFIQENSLIDMIS